jgi:hypothetical protein
MHEKEDNRTLMTLIGLIFTDKPPLKGKIKISEDQYHQSNQCSILRDFVAVNKSITNWNNNGKRRSLVNLTFYTERPVV